MFVILIVLLLVFFVFLFALLCLKIGVSYLDSYIYIHKKSGSIVFPEAVYEDLEWDVVTIIPFVYYSVKNKRYYFTKFFCSSWNNYAFTYIYRFFGFRILSKFCLTKVDLYECLYNNEFYWSPVYDVSTKRVKEFNSKFKLFFTKYYSYVLQPAFVSIYVFFLVFFNYYLNWPVEFTLTTLFYLRFLAIVIFILLLALIYGLFFSKKSDEYFITRWLFLLIYFLYKLLGMFPYYLVGVFSFLLNLVILHIIFDLFGFLDLYFYVIMTYSLLTFIWSSFVKLFEKFGYKLPFCVSQNYSVLLFPTGAFVLYVIYSILWWVFFIYKAYKNNDMYFCLCYIENRLSGEFNDLLYNYLSLFYEKRFFSQKHFLKDKVGHRLFEAEPYVLFLLTYFVRDTSYIALHTPHDLVVDSFNNILIEEIESKEIEKVKLVDVLKN